MSLGAAGAPDQFEASVALLEAAGVDSLWLPETVFGPAVDPFTGMTFALAKTTHLKVGSGISVLPGRHPVLVAKQLASLAGLAPGRVLPVFGLQPAVPGERALFPVPAGQRGAVFDEALALLRLMLTTDVVSFHGSFFTVEDASVGPLPAKPLDIWLAGSAPAGLRRVGGSATAGSARCSPRPRRARPSPSSTPPRTRRDGRWTPITSGSAWRSRSAACRTRSPPRSSAAGPDADPAALVADGWAGARDLIASFADAGLSKFVVRPATAPESLEDFVAGFTRELAPLQT